MDKVLTEYTLEDLHDIVISKGYQYYICQCCLWYGKESCNNSIDIDYISEVGGNLDYKKAFLKLIDKHTDNNQEDKDG